MSSIFRKPWMSWLLSGVAVALLIATLVTAVSAFAVQMKTQAVLKPSNPTKPVETAAAQTDGPEAPKDGEEPGGDRENEAKKNPELSESFNKLLADKAFFGKQTRNPQLQSVVGEYAIIDGQWIRLGEEQNGVKVLEINGDKVKIEFEGNQRDLNLFQDMPGIPQPRPRVTPPPVVAAEDGQTTGSAPAIPTGDVVAVAGSETGVSAALDPVSAVNAPNITREQRIEAQRALIRQRMEPLKRESNQ